MVLPAQLLTDPIGMLTALRVIATGKTPVQIERLRQRRRALALMLQQLQTSLHHIGLRQTELPTETVQPSLTGVIQANRDGAHRRQHQAY